MHKLKRCLNCNKFFDRPLRSKKTKWKVSWNYYNKMKFCSTQCYAKWSSKYRRGSNTSNWRGGKTRCVDCGKELSARYTSRPGVHRCRECWRKFLKQYPEKHPNWKGGNRGNFCIDCGKSIYRGGQRCRQCWFKHNRGKNNGAYKEILTYKYLHTIIRKKFGNSTKCAFCGFTSNNSRLIHWANISGKYLRDKSNWLPLCVKCHRNFDLKRKS